MAEEYDSIQTNLSDATQLDEEISWYKERHPAGAHATFMDEMAELRRILQSLSSNTTGYQSLKMIYAHAVTLMEAFLGDSIKSLVLTNDIGFNNAISSVDELSKSRFSLKEINQHKNGAKGLAARELANILYHNIPKVKKLLELTLATKIDLNINALTNITHMRHDIVHRNGKTIEGDTIALDDIVVLNAIEEIEKFTSTIQKVITSFLLETEKPF